SAGEVVHFRTAMTGEIFGLMAGASVLRHAVGARADWDEAAFEAGVDDTMSRPERILTESFTLRARALLEGMPPAIARARLSGLLIGAELAAMKPYWLGQDVAIIGAEALSERYRAALALTGLEPRIAPAAEMTRAGLLAARERISP
ncbi:MAG: 2-dehydro-3-deoxygalactonokinase, partial [Rubricella sp.]